METQNMLPRKRRELARALVWLFVLLFPALLGTPAALCAPATDQAAVLESVSFSLDGDRLSVAFDGVPLNQVLLAVSQKGGITMVCPDPAEERIYARFTSLPVGEGLDKILNGRDYIFFYTGKKRRLRTVWVYLRRNEKTIPQEPSPAATFQHLVEKDPPQEDIEQGQASRHAEEQGEVDVFAQLLAREEDPSIREAVLSAMMDIHEGEVLLDVALQDIQQEFLLQGEELMNLLNPEDSREP